jgi:phospholipase C
MQIDGGKNDRFAAYTDIRALVMGSYDHAALPLWDVAKKYTLADNVFMGGFGGSFFNHFWLVCACAPVYRNADYSSRAGLLDGLPGREAISVLDRLPLFIAT